MRILSITSKICTTSLLTFVISFQQVSAFEIKSYVAFTSIEEFLLAALQVIITIAIPIIVLFIIYAGFQYVTARGNAEQTQQATRTLTYAIIGGVIMLGAVAIGEIIKNLVNAFAA
jgi:hypothetical protein